MHTLHAGICNSLVSVSFLAPREAGMTCTWTVRPKCATLLQSPPLLAAEPFGLRPRVAQSGPSLSQSKIQLLSRLPAAPPFALCLYLQGYPGQLEISVQYTLARHKNELTVKFQVCRPAAVAPCATSQVSEPRRTCHLHYPPATGMCTMAPL